VPIEVTSGTRYLGLGRIFIAISSTDTDPYIHSHEGWCSGNPQNTITTIRDVKTSNLILIKTYGVIRNFGTQTSRKEITNFPHQN
jgi:hypothetical protein